MPAQVNIVASKAPRIAVALFGIHTLLQIALLVAGWEPELKRTILVGALRNLCLFGIVIFFLVRTRRYGWELSLLILSVQLILSCRNAAANYPGLGADVDDHIAFWITALLLNLPIVLSVAMFLLASSRTAFGSTMRRAGP